MARVRKYLNFLNGWEQVNTAAEANAAEVPHMEPMRIKLQALLEQARTLSAQQGALTSGKQDASKELRKLIRKGQKLVDFMRTGAVEHYGPESEKLVEFGVQPFRGRVKKAETKPPANPNAKAPDSASPAPSPETTK